MSARRVRLGLRENLAQFSLLVAVQAFVGAMVGLERSTLPLIGREDFGLSSKAAVLSFIAAFGLAKAFTNLGAGAYATRVGRRRLLIAGWAVALPQQPQRRARVGAGSALPRRPRRRTGGDRARRGPVSHGVGPRASLERPLVRSRGAQAAYRRGDAPAGGHRIGWRVASEAALDFWERRLADEGVPSMREGGRLPFADPEGLEHELEVYEGGEAPLVPAAPDVPAEFALQSFAGARAYASDPGRSAHMLGDALAFTEDGEGTWRVAGEQRSSYWIYDEPPAERGIPGGGTVHHVAFASPMDAHAAWRERMLDAGANATPVIDRFWFRSVYLREPSGVLFELATIGPGFTADEPTRRSARRSRSRPTTRAYRVQPERTLMPLPDPRAERRRAVSAG